MRTILELKNIEASYAQLKVLHGISIKVHENEIVALIGPNGAGKSTVLKAIMSLVKKNKGHIIFENKHIEHIKTHKIVEKGISLVPQGRIVFQNLTVEENLEMGAFLINDKNLVKERLEAVYHFFPILKEKRYEGASNLSGGQQQMVSIGRSLMLKPKILLMDEPSLGLSPKVIHEVFEKIKDINKKFSTTIIIVEQNAHKAIEICDRCYILEQGKVALEGTSNLATDPRVKKLYLGG